MRAETSKTKKNLKTAEMRMLRAIRRVTWGDKVRNEQMRKDCNVQNIGGKVD